MKKHLQIISVLFLLVALALGTATPVAAQTATTYLVSGTVTDATAGWGVYARLDIEGFGSVVTNPSNGVYSVGLTAGTYNITVVGLWPGYVNTTATLTVAGNMTRNFTLGIDNTVCSGPGYVAGGFTENFDNVTAPALPDGWAIKKTRRKGDPVWETLTSTTIPAGYAPHSGINLAYFNASQLIKNSGSRLYRYRSVDLTATTNYTLTFWMFHDPAGRNDQLSVQVSTDGGNNWSTVQTFYRHDGTTTGWVQHSVSLATFSTATNVMIGFDARTAPSGTAASDIFIDDISFGSPTNCQPVSGGGLVIGHVLDANTGLGINDGFVSGYNATVTGSNYETVTFSTPADASRPDGFFALFQPAGTSTLTASATAYSTQTQNATVESRRVTQLTSNFILQAARLTVTGSPVTLNLGGGAIGTRTITISNTGSLDTTYWLTENASWLSLSAATAETYIGPSPASQIITLTFNAAGLAPGVYSTEIIFADLSPYQVAPIPVTLVVSLPTAYNDSYTVNEDDTLTVPATGVLSNDQNPLVGTMTAALVSGPANGTLGLNPDGSFTYTPNANFSGSDSFTYRAVVGTSQSNVATVTLTVNPLNDLPVAITDNYGTTENTPVTMPVLQNDTDADGDTLSITAVGTPLRGSAAITPGNTSTITYIPNPNTFGPDSFSYTISDGKGGSAVGTVNVTVTAVNDPPVAGDDEATTNEDTQVEIHVLDNDTDIDGDTRSVASVIQPTNGSATITAGGNTITYAPNENFNGPDSFAYTVSDGNGGTDTATVSVTVAPINDAPVCHRVDIETNEDTDASQPTFCEDVDEDELTFEIFEGPSNGAAEITGEDLFYHPALNFNGSDVFTYRTYDGSTYSEPAEAHITVTPVNDAPVAGDDAATTNEDMAATITVLSNDDDVDNDSLTVIEVSDPPNGSATINTADNTITYTPDDDFNGEDSFTYTISDGQSGSASATVTVIVRPVNDTPSFTMGSDQTVDEDAAAQTMTGWATNISTGPHNESTQIIDFIVDNNNHALFSTQPAVSPEGDLTFTPANDAFGSATVTVQIHDNGGTVNGGVDTSATQTFAITVTSINDAPVAADDTAGTGEDTPVDINVLVNDDDPENDPLTVTEVSDPTYGSAERNADNTITYTPDENFSGEDSFTYTISDGQDGTDTATVTVTVGASNDNPTASADAETILEDHSVTINVLSNDTDPDGGAPDVQSVGDPANGTTVLNTDDTVTYTPDADFFGTDSFTYTITDGQGGSASATVTVTVNPVNDAPSFTKGADQTVDEDAAAQTVSGWATAISAGPDNESTQIKDFVVSNDNNDLFSAQPAISPMGELTYTPAVDAYGSATVTVQIHDDGGIENDGIDTSTAQTFTITVNSVNDVPSFTKGADQTVNEDIGAQTVAGWATEISTGPTNEGTQTVVFIVSNDNNDLFSAQPLVSPVGTLTYTPAGNAHGSAIVTVQIHDDGGGNDTSVEQSFIITVSPVNDAPVCLAVNINTTEDTAGTTSPNCMDVDGDPLTFEIFAQPANGSSAVLDEDVLLQYTPHSDFNGNDIFQYVADDGTIDSSPANVNVSVGSVNDLPTALNDTPETDEDTVVIIDVLANDGDTDGGTLTVESISDGPDHGTAVIENNKVTYTPAADYFGTDEFTYTMSDGQGGTATALVTVTVKSVNDAPVGEEDHYDAVFQSVLTVTSAEGLLANDSDIENDSLSAVLVSSTTHGTLVLNPDGSFTYTPAARYVGPDSFTYRCSDGTDTTEAITVNITVKAYQVFLPLLRR